jgi:hypothetical protein
VDRVVITSRSGASSKRSDFIIWFLWRHSFSVSLIKTAIAHLAMMLTVANQSLMFCDQRRNDESDGC